MLVHGAWLWWLRQWQAIHVRDDSFTNDGLFDEPNWFGTNDQIAATDQTHLVSMIFMGSNLDPAKLLTLSKLRFGSQINLYTVLQRYISYKIVSDLGD